MAKNRNLRFFDSYGEIHESWLKTDPILWFQSWFDPKVARNFFTASQSGGNFEKWKISKMEAVSLTHLFLKLWKVLGSLIQNLRSLIIVDFTKREIFAKSSVVWELRGFEVCRSWLKNSTSQSVTIENFQRFPKLETYIF